MIERYPEENDMQDDQSEVDVLNDIPVINDHAPSDINLNPDQLMDFRSAIQDALKD